ncbi:MAG: acetylglutamate kinase, partial [bacterium]
MSNSTQQTREIIVRLLGAIGSRKEVEQYLKQYSTADQKQFAVVKIGGGLIRDNIDELASSLTFLQRVGLFPIVIHGAGPQLDDALVEAGIPIRKVDGMRITDSDTLEVVRRVTQRENLRLVDALEALGSRARPINTGVFEARVRDADKLGWVGEITRVHLEAISGAIRAGHLPILSCLGETPSGQIVNINADVAAAELAVAIQPFKIVFLTPTGGMLDGQNNVINSINLSEDYERLMSQEWVHSGMRLKLREIRELLERLPLASSVSITSARDLARELFTHRGAGTFIQRGESVLEFTSWDGVDLERMRDLLETGFGKSLDSNYFEKKDVLKIYVTESYRATAVITREGP